MFAPEPPGETFTKYISIFFILKRKIEKHNWNQNFLFSFHKPVLFEFMVVVVFEGTVKRNDKLSGMFIKLSDQRTDLLTFIDPIWKQYLVTLSSSGGSRGARPSRPL